jgi:arabinose-5-phosphate isomerase
MTTNPITISNQMIVSSAISLMNNKKITSLFVLEDRKPRGIVHLHDLINITAL